MNVDRFKALVAPPLMAVVAVVVLGSILGAALLQRQASQGADPADAFTSVPDGIPALEDLVVWEPDGPLQERAVEPATRRGVEAAWTRAWDARRRAAAGDPSLLDAWFSGPALDQARRVTAGPPVEVRLGEQHLQITFYSDDGGVIGLRADPVRVQRAVEVDGRRHVQTEDEAYDAVLVLEDGTWRVRQWQRVVTTADGALRGS